MALLPKNYLWTKDYGFFHCITTLGFYYDVYFAEGLEMGFDLGKKKEGFSCAPYQLLAL